MFSRRFQGRKTSFEVCNWLVVLSGGTALRAAGGGPAGTRPLVTRDGWWVFTSRQGTDILDIPTRVQLLYNTLHIILNLMMKDMRNSTDPMGFLYKKKEKTYMDTFNNHHIKNHMTRPILPVVLHCFISSYLKWNEILKCYSCYIK